MARLLVVEDEPALRHVLGEVLRGEGHEVAVAGDGMRALAVLDIPPPPQLILMDLHLPRLGGRALLARLRADGRWRAIPAILITGTAFDPAEFPPPRAYQALLPKPFDLDALLGAVRQCLRRP
jgi:CheY-like chemotaxis protein